MPITATLTVSFGLAAREVDFSQGPAIRLAAPALLRKLRRSVISVSPYLSWRELHAMNFRWLILSSAPQDGGQVNQAAPRLDVQGFDFGAAVVFDAQIIQPRVAFDDGLQQSSG
jgi:hypothetical protein